MNLLITFLNIYGLFNLSVSIDNSAFERSYRFVFPNGVDNQGIGGLVLQSDRRLRTSQPIPFAVWETLPDGTTQQQVMQYTMRFTAIQAMWHGDAPSESISSKLITTSIDDVPVSIGANFNVDSRANHHSLLSIASEPLPETLPVIRTYRSPWQPYL